MNPISLEDQYRKIMADHITVSIEDLTSNEMLIVNKGWYMFNDKLQDIKIANDEIKRLTIELANYKAMYQEDTRPSNHVDEDDENMD
jgi:hypothetical protein